jgi:hypothetical protein
MAGEGLEHAVFAGAVGASSIACGAATGPLLAIGLDIAAAAATAGIAGHAVSARARARGVSPAGILHRAARRAVKRSDAPLAAHAVDVMCRARSGDRRALRAAAILLGRATSAHARGLALQLLGSWCAPLRDLTQLGAPLGAARAAVESAAFVNEMVAAVREQDVRGVTAPVKVPVPVTVQGDFWGNDEPSLDASDVPDAHAPAPAHHISNANQDWEVAA